MSTPIENNTEKLLRILEIANTLPDANAGGGGRDIKTITIEEV